MKKAICVIAYMWITLLITGCNFNAASNQNVQSEQAQDASNASEEKFLPHVENHMPDDQLFFFINSTFPNFVNPPDERVLSKVTKQQANGLYLYQGEEQAPLLCYVGNVLYCGIDDTTCYFLVDEQNGDYAVYCADTAGACEKICVFSMPDNHFTNEIGQGIKLYQDVLFFANEEELYQLDLLTGTFALLYKDDAQVFDTPLLQAVPLSNYTFYAGTNGGYITFPFILYSARDERVYSISEEEADFPESSEDFRLYLYELYQKLR